MKDRDSLNSGRYEPRRQHTDKELDSWFKNLPPVPPQEAKRIGKMLDSAFAKVLGRPPRLSFAEDHTIVVPNVYGNPGVQEISKELRERIDSGEDSVATLTDWRRHLFAVTYGLPKEGFCPPARCPFHPEQEQKPGKS